jgi:DNA-binding transcriptional MerR regulator
MQDKETYQIELPDKFYFKIGEVSKITGLPSHVLRFWETEFRKIRPRRTAAGQRSYTQKDIKRILEIKHLLYDRKYTIAGARNYLNARDKSRPVLSVDLVEELKTELRSIRDLIDK